MSWDSIPRGVPRFLHRHPALLTRALGLHHRLRNIHGQWRSRAVIAVATIALLVAVLLVATLASGRAESAVRLALEYRILVSVIAGLYFAALIARRQRDLAIQHQCSWLVATALMQRNWRASIVIALLLSFLAHLLTALAVLMLLALDPAISIAQMLQVSAAAALGALAGVSVGVWLSRRGAPAVRHEDSRYTVRARRSTHFAPSSAALARWPIAQALAWGRPENARLLFMVVIASVPGGAGALGGLCIIALWVVSSYLFALLLAIPQVARTAAQWLRSTPIGFRAFAWPIARRALAHQLLGTVLAGGALLVLGLPLIMALYLATLWLTLAVLIATVSLADCYRARAPALKSTISLLMALLAEERAHGLGISFALAMTAWQVRAGLKFEENPA